MKSTTAIATRHNQNLASALSEAEQRYIAANPMSARLSAEARANLPGGNTRTTVHFSPFPLYVASGKGSRLTDADGHVYTDFINEYTAGVFGHSNPIIAQTINETIAKGLNFGAPTRHEIALSAEIGSGLRPVGIFKSKGSAAVTAPKRRNAYIAPQDMGSHKERTRMIFSIRTPGR